MTHQDGTFSEFLRRTCYDYTTPEENGWDIRVVHVDLDYRAPARFDD